MSYRSIEIIFLMLCIILGIYTVIFTILQNAKQTKLEITKNKLKYEEEKLDKKQLELTNKKTKIKALLEDLDLKKAELTNLEIDIQNKNASLKNEQADFEIYLKNKTAEIDVIKEEILSMSKEEVYQTVKEEVTTKKRNILANELKLLEDQYKLDQKVTAQRILISAMESTAVDTTNEIVLKTIAIPNESVKGRLIGREGRNIKLLENILGVNLIIDDTPETIFISCFNAKRRAIAQLVLESLVNSGRINQSSIEEEYNKMSQRVEEIALEKGRDALFQFGITSMQPELISEIGYMDFRSSIGQNLLAHSIEAAAIAAKVAQELSLDPVLAARCLLLHDIGKNESPELGDSHVSLGVKMARKYGESEIVINAIEAHHNDVEPDSIYAILTIIADSVSAGRTGARRNQLDNFIKRVEALENIATSIEGVSNAYALNGGREVRVFVQSSKVDDNELRILADTIRNKIQEDLSFPGIIKVRVIRETSAYADATKENIGV